MTAETVVKKMEVEVGEGLTKGLEIVEIVVGVVKSRGAAWAGKGSGRTVLITVEDSPMRLFATIERGRAGGGFATAVTTETGAAGGGGAGCGRGHSEDGGGGRCSEEGGVRSQDWGRRGRGENGCGGNGGGCRHGEGSRNWRNEDMGGDGSGWRGLRSGTGLEARPNDAGLIVVARGQTTLRGRGRRHKRNRRERSRRLDSGPVIGAPGYGGGAATGAMMGTAAIGAATGAKAGALPPRDNSVWTALKTESNCAEPPGISRTWLVSSL
ncbi:hypothetical protein B0H17DRAFT_1139096 [Mycena rosella]|uniref:Uncharacterized protein n=1 Tax=Mycena rosella TaxID=1033263 RepID=A0AAD7GCX7_MYCRO|nr:hypothetical protein B0H17DRAFT_1139096 [Mycena rosella]